VPAADDTAAFQRFYFADGERSWGADGERSWGADGERSWGADGERSLSEPERETPSRSLLYRVFVGWWRDRK
jgi:hypothetical protein